MTITTVPAVAQPGPCTCAIPRSLPRRHGLLHGPCAVPCGRFGSGRRQPVPGAYLGGTSAGTRYEHTRVVTSHFRNVHPYLQRRRQGCELLGLTARLFFSFFFFGLCNSLVDRLFSFRVWSCVSGWRGSQTGRRPRDESRKESKRDEMKSAYFPV